MFLKNCWYVAAWDREVADEPLARTICNEPVVLYRKQDGTPAALEDRCGHRNLPLSLGKVVGDNLQCGYHGVEFDCTGKCANVPGQDNTPSRARIKSYPVIEKWNWIWIWMGDPARVDHTLFPDWWWVDHPEWAFARPDMLPVKADYRLFNDNLLDVSHLQYVHTGSIGADSITEFPIECEVEDRKVSMRRWIRDREPPPTYRKAGGFKGNVDRCQLAEYYPPCFTANHAAVFDVEDEVQDFNRGFRVNALSAPTPETETSCHYFFGFVRAFLTDDAAFEEKFTSEFVRVFKEDVAILEAQQRANDHFGDAPKFDIKVDAAPKAARRMLEKLIAEEQTEAEAAKVAAE